MADRTCWSCGETKPLDLFGKNRTKTLGRASECRECANRMAREYQARRATESGEYQSTAWRRENGRRDPVYVHRCEQCGFEFTAKRKSARFCSKACSHGTGRKWLVPYVGPPTVTLLPERHPARQPAERRTDWWTVLVSGPCARCGETFTALSCDTGAGLPRYCSRRCAKRKPSVRGAFRVSRTFRLAIYERDGWCCQLCGEAVERDGDPLGDWAPSLDHIIPRSQGGSDDATNLRTAHRWCNAVLNDGRKYCPDDLKVA